MGQKQKTTNFLNLQKRLHNKQASHLNVKHVPCCYCLGNNLFLFNKAIFKMSMMSRTQIKKYFLFSFSIRPLAVDVQLSQRRIQPLPRRLLPRQLPAAHHDRLVDLAAVASNGPCRRGRRFQPGRRPLAQFERQRRSLRRTRRRQPQPVNLVPRRPPPSLVPVFPDLSQVEEEGQKTEGRSRRGSTQAQVTRGHDHLPLGVLAQAFAGQGELSSFHQVDESREGSFQVG